MPTRHICLRGSWKWMCRGWKRFIWLIPTHSAHLVLASAYSVVVKQPLGGVRFQSTSWTSTDIKLHNWMQTVLKAGFSPIFHHIQLGNVIFLLFIDPHFPLYHSLRCWNSSGKNWPKPMCEASACECVAMVSFATSKPPAWHIRLLLINGLVGASVIAVLLSAMRFWKAI